ncbi:class I adenylate cyclase [uncultured Pseudodesulfovibrio sp.]|uniref:class I adenylate cyclase n=1 Tax=uncultured Pseudodesulfovibrio sp. TaxID=2035858 RepID=UPI0029C985D5|nr:class I adenylate cyclase [uncultured Pseudodesulfovibrio sp.]
MSTEITDIAQLSTMIRNCSSMTASSEVPDIKSVVQNFIRALDRREPPSVFHTVPVADACLNFYRLIHQSKDSHIIRLCLSALLRAGKFGRSLAARFVAAKAVSLREMAAIVTGLDACDRLALGHEMLLDYPGDHDKQTISWLEGLMTPLATTDPAELLPFLTSLGRNGEELAFPARQTLKSGAFGKWMTTRLKTGASGEELEDICHLLIAMNDPEMAATLAVSISVGFISPTPLSLRTVTQVTEVGERRVLDMFIKLLKSAHKDIAGHCLDGIIAQNAKSAGKLLATIRVKMPSLKRAANSRVPLLEDKALQSYFAALPDSMRESARSDAFSALLALAPDFVNKLTHADFDQPTPSSDEDAYELTKKIEPCPKERVLARFFGSRRKTLEKLLPKRRNIRDIELVCSNVEKEELDGREFSGLKLTRSTFTDVTFIRTKMANCNLAGSAISGGATTGCNFKNVDFSAVDIMGMNFSKCSFTNCNFTGTGFTDCRFSDCRFRECSFGGAAFLNTKMRMTGFNASSLAGISFYESDIRSTRFETVDLTNAQFSGSRFQGVEFPGSILRAASIDETSFHSVDMPGASVSGCRIINSDISHPFFLGNKLQELPELAERAAGEPLPDPAVIPPEAAAKVLTSWARELTFLKREERMLEFNRKRLNRAISSIEKTKQVYVRIMPHLINTNVFEQKFNLDNVPSCEVWGYSPCLTTLELAKHYFPDYKPSRGKRDIRITAVYAMGSLGTVAQTAKSDIDCWVCYEGQLTPEAEHGLKKKLDALGLWAESEFGIEAHFFPMSMDDVRANRFSSGDEESSGSAQALLLKEEFYRTALRIAGKNIAWWVTPAGASQKAYEANLSTIKKYPTIGRKRLEDFGHLAPVPPTEYFGGALWQMVKAVHSPFKSVLKLGLLETYADTSASRLTLCDRIKHNLFLRRRGVQRADPYGALFATLHNYYAKRGDKEAARLLTESFMFKANLQDIPFFLNLPARFEDASLIEALFGKGYTDPEKVKAKKDNRSFDSSLKVGTAVREYMVHTYQRIQDGLKKQNGAGTLINAEDLTRMGRRIAANFSRKTNKIMRVPFMDTKGNGFAILHLCAEKAPGKKTIWVTRGGSKSEAKKSADALQLLHRSGDPVHMLAWLLANRIYSPKTHLQADRTIAPISVADLQKLMPALHEFFPFDETFERDINEGLEAESVTRIFLIFNLMAPPESKKIEQAAVIYTTNWGEMYCRTFNNPGPLFEKEPSRFLAQKLEQPVDGIPEMLLFIPKGSQCKRINLV